MSKLTKSERGMAGIDTLMGKALDAADDIRAPTKDQRITGVSKKVACALIAARTLVLKADGWDESNHKRNHGQFSSTGGGSSKVDPEDRKYLDDKKRKQQGDKDHAEGFRAPRSDAEEARLKKLVEYGHSKKVQDYGTGDTGSPMANEAGRAKKPSPKVVGLYRNQLTGDLKDAATLYMTGNPAHIKAVPKETMQALFDKVNSLHSDQQIGAR
jgi:hypothetical protein